MNERIDLNPAEARLVELHERQLREAQGHFQAAVTMLLACHGVEGEVEVVGLEGDRLLVRRPSPAGD